MDQKKALPLNESLSYAEQALALMQQHHIEPIPENYTIWFHYSQGKNADLIREIDNLIQNGLGFSQEISSYLHNKFIMPSASQKIIDDTAANSGQVLMDVLHIISEFGNETHEYNKNVDGYLQKISLQFEDQNIRSVIGELVKSTAHLRESGKKLSKKLEESAHEIVTLKKDLEQVVVESQRDFLTGAYNRKTFEKYADEQIPLAKQSGQELCLFMIDIDHFKRFNDRFGHLLGDEVLKTVARTLINILKGQDMVARFGGEEFIVILPATPMEGAVKVAEAIRSTIATRELKRKDNGETFGTITVSLGIARLHHETDTLPLLIKRADKAMYVSKENGRNRATCES